MAKPNYRVVLSFDAERKVFHARAPELEHCSAEGETRADAISKLELEIDAQLQNMTERGHRAPQSVDEVQWSGEVAAKVSRTLHRDLAWLARSEGIELGQLVSEMLTAGLDARRHHGRPPRHRPEQQPNDNAGNVRDFGNERGGGDRGRGGGYAARFHMMEDRANFIEYVRGLESEQGRGGPRPQRPPGDRGPGGPGGGGPGGGGGGGNNRRRGRGGFQGPMREGRGDGRGPRPPRDERGAAPRDDRGGAPSGGGVPSGGGGPDGEG